MALSAPLAKLKMPLIFYIVILGFSFIYQWGIEGMSGDWYQSLNISPLTPSNGIINIIWPFLCPLLAASLWLIWKTPDSKDKNIAIILFVVQLLAHFMWPVVFFIFKSVIFSYLWMLIILFMALGVTKNIFLLSKNAGLLILPYIAWLIFSFYLALHILIYNLN